MAPVITTPPSEPVGTTHDTIPLGEYLFLRIAQANPSLKSALGIPGDFNLALLEHLYSPAVAEKMEFVGFCNELNAAYAADGYAKHMNSLSMLITTYGVGELSALNGVAGAFAEFAPVMHIVGTTSTVAMEQARNTSGRNVCNIHHLVQSKNALESPDHDVYKKIVEPFSVVQESLDLDMDANLDKIDHVIVKVLQERRPGYLFVPLNISDIAVPSHRLAQPLPLSELADISLVNSIAARILQKLYSAKKPSVVGDALTGRFGAGEQLNQFAEELPRDHVKLFSTLMGRFMDETRDNHIGIYSGKLSQTKHVVDVLENETDVLLVLGYLNNEVNSGIYSRDYSKISDYVEVHPDYIYIDGEMIMVKDPVTGKRSFAIADLVAALARDVDASRFQKPSLDVRCFKQGVREMLATDSTPQHELTQNKLIDFFNQYMRPNDILVVDLCSFIFGVGDIVFPRGTQFYNQNFYGSIGYALPATFGVCRAERDLGTNRRVLLVQGDGLAQMTVQEWSTYLRYDIQAPEIFLLNNEGYTVERIIKGATRSYNDIQATWDWTKLLLVFGDSECEKHDAEKLETTSDLVQLLGQKRSSKIRFYDLKLHKMDVPDRFHLMLSK